MMSTVPRAMTTRGSDSSGGKGRTQPDASSLGSLSRRFLEFAETRVDGVVDLNETARKLNAHKRRVYDVTNVLEGVELLEKITKNYVRWTPHRLETESHTNLDVEQLQKEIAELEETLQETDTEIEAVYANLRDLNGVQERKELFLRDRDILALSDMKDRRCFVLKVPEKTKLHGTKNTLTVVSREGEIFAREMRFREVGVQNGQNAPMEIDEACKENHS